ncbi:hypothetical protein [Galbibacter sp. BG1]
MKTYPEDYNISVTFPFTDLNDQPVVPISYSATLYDDEETPLFEVSNPPFDPDLGHVEVVIPKEFNRLGVGQLTAGRVLHFSLHTADGVIPRKFSYVIEGTFRLVIMQNSFLTLEGAELVAREMINIPGWNNASEENRNIALIEAFNRLTRIPMRFRTENGDNDRGRLEMFAQETVIQRSQWPTITREDFMNWPANFRKALRKAQITEANELLEGDPIAKKHRAGILSETIGESSMMLRSGKVERDVSSTTLQQLSGFIYYSHRIARSS